MSKPLISIIIPTYNRASLIGETLDSIIAQTYTNWECIIIDDGSTDNTTNVITTYLEKDNRFQYHIRPETHKSGGCGARNYGFKLSKGDYINWFDSDDLMFENHLELHLQNFLKNPEINLSSSKAIVFESNSDNIVGDLVSRKTTSTNLIYDLVLGNIAFLTPCSVWKNEGEIKSVLFNEKLFRAQESDLNFRRAQKNIVFKYLKQSTVKVRRGHDSIDSQSGKDSRKMQSQFDYFYNILNSLRLVDLKNDIKKFKEIQHYVFFRLLVIYATIRAVDCPNAKLFSISNKKTILNFTKKLNLLFFDRMRVHLGVNMIYYLKKGYSLIYIKKFKIKK